MEKVAYLITIVMCSCVSLNGKPIELDVKLTVPPYKDVVSNPDLSASKVNSLIVEGDISKLYREAYELFQRMPHVDTEEFTDEELKNRIWLFYYMAAAPIYKAEYSPETEYPFRITPDSDLRAKEGATTFMLRYDFYDIFKRLTLDRKEATDLISTYYARILRDFRENYDPEIRQKIDKIGREGNSNSYIVQDRKRWRNFEDKLIANKRRNTVLEHSIKYMEKDFVEMLVLYYPGKAHEVYKYIRQAGYEGDDANDLIDRTVGRDETTEFLYKGANGRKHDRKVREHAKHRK